MSGFCLDVVSKDFDLSLLRFKDGGQVYQYQDMYNMITNYGTEHAKELYKKRYHLELLNFDDLCTDDIKTIFKYKKKISRTLLVIEDYEYTQMYLDLLATRDEKLLLCAVTESRKNLISSFWSLRSIGISWGEFWEYRNQEWARLLGQRYICAWARPRAKFITEANYYVGRIKTQPSFDLLLFVKFLCLSGVQYLILENLKFYNEDLPF